MRVASLSLIALPTLALLGCPVQVPAPEKQDVVHTSAGDPTPGNVPITPADDPRVVRDTGDLYDVEDPSPTPEQAELGLGSGKPDETNGECRLYAPKLPEPHCCPFEVGFDAQAIRELCGHAIYLGESLQHSCGYFFSSAEPGATPVFMRGSKLMGVGSVAEAAKQHDERLRMALDKPEFGSTPVPGLEGAMWSGAEGLHWAFLPGWENVRQISWNDGACSDEKMAQVLKLIAEAVPPPPNAPREGLLPTARKPAASKDPASKDPASK
jgi:hypothetical protein